MYVFNILNFLVFRALRSFMRKGKKSQTPTEKSSNHLNGDASPIVYRRAIQCKLTMTDSTLHVLRIIVRIHPYGCGAKKHSTYGIKKIEELCHRLRCLRLTTGNRKSHKFTILIHSQLMLIYSMITLVLTEPKPL